jgi:phosphate transport system substrate-binding protein
MSFLWQYFLYPLCVLVGGFFLLPLGVSFSLAGGPLAACLAVCAAALAAGWLTARVFRLPEKFIFRYWPVLLPVFGAGLAFVLGTFASGGGLYAESMSWPILFSPGFFVALAIDCIETNSGLPPFLPILHTFLYAAAFAFREQRAGRVRIPRSVRACAAGLILAIAASGSVFAYRHTHDYLSHAHGFQYEGGFSSVDLSPYYIDDPNNILPLLSREASFIIRETERMPVLDGAEAAYPVYAAFAKACYAPPELTDIWDKVTFSNTVNAFNLLVRGKVDIFFGAEPSPEQKKKAVEQGEELVLAPIGREAFVFFVPGENPLVSLDADALRGIYSGKIASWKELGGMDMRITAFQRPDGSGSQTVMRQFMGALPLARPLREEMVSPMSGVIDRVAGYRNMPGAIGYSFRFFLTAMHNNSAIRLLALDGVEPSQENLRNGSYPYIVPLYAVVLKGNTKPEVWRFLEWMQGPQGRELVEKVGYAAP